MQDVFEKIRKRIHEFVEQYRNTERITWTGFDWLIKEEDILEIVKEVAAEYNNGWIPCSERLPEDGKEVLVTDGKYVYLVEYDADLDAGFGDMDGIVAWQPLP